MVGRGIISGQHWAGNSPLLIHFVCLLDSVYLAEVTDIISTHYNRFKDCLHLAIKEL